MPAKTARFALLFLASVCFLVRAEVLDPEFSKIPFERWTASSEDSTGLRWNLRGGHTQLSLHERLVSDLEVQIDGAGLETRRGSGELIVYFQIADEQGQRYQSHETIDLTKLDADVRRSYVTYTQRAFLLPGKYRLSAVLFFSSTQEHSAKQQTIRLGPLKKDPLPDSWRNLPPIELITSTDPPASWYLPEVRGRLYLPVVRKRPVQIEMIVNITASQASFGPRAATGRRTLAELLPVFKTLGQLDLSSGSVNAEMVDLSRRKVIWRQTAVRELDWEAISAALAEANPDTIDLKSLSGRHHGAAFFVSEARRRLEAPGDAAEAPGAERVLIVVSSPVTFEPGEDLEPIQLEEPQHYRVYYFKCGRFRNPIRPPMDAMSRTRGRGRGRMPFPSGRLPEIGFDQLAPTLKPLSPRVIEIETPEEFRKALARVLSELSGN